MIPTTDVYIYFYIILSGFMTVWAYRKTIGSERKVSEFEYIGFSAFWGIILIVFYNWAKTQNPPPSVDLLSNPFVAGLCLSVFGMFFALIVGSVWRFSKRIYRLGWKKAFQNRN